jgi:hypothetical protein
MKRYNFLIGFFILTAAIVYMFYPKNANVGSTENTLSPIYENKSVASIDTSPEMQAMTEKETSKDTAITKPPTILVSEIKVLKANYPDKDKVNEDVKKYPHTPSKSLMTFAKRIGPLMEKAFKNESDATLMVKELSNCAYDESVASAARALCVTNTERLADTFPKLEKPAQELRAGVSPEIQKILDTNDMIRQR